MERSRVYGLSASIPLFTCLKGSASAPNEQEQGMTMRSKQMTLAGNGFQKFSKTTQRAQFLAEIGRALPQAELYVLRCTRRE